MTPDEYREQDATGLATLIRSGAVSEAEVATAARRALEEAHARLNCLAELYEDPAPSFDGPLRGVPFLYKDAGAHEAGRAQTAGSRLLAGNVAASDTRLVQRLRAAGLVSMGRGTSSELTYHSSVESAAFGPTCNPWDPARTAGGSSGGCAAAVAVGAVPLAHATDGGGSIRIPAAWCGLVGLKPSRGRVSWAPDMGETLYGMATEHVLTRSVRDTALLLDILHGHEAGDPFHIAPPAGAYADLPGRPVAPLRIGLVTADWAGGWPLDPELEAATRATARALEAAGHAVEEARITFDSEAWLKAIADSWCAQLAAWVLAVQAATGRKPEAHLEPATLVCFRHGLSLSAVELNFAFLAFNAVCRSVGSLFERFDLLVTPTTAVPAPELGRLSPAQQPASALEWTRHMFGPAPFTATFNTTGHPAISLPLAQTAQGLPVGVQLVAGHGGEDLLIGVAAHLELVMPWAGRRPALHP